MEYSLSMTFGTSNGQKATIKISDVKENLTEDQISSLMNTIIEKDIFLTSKGTLTSKISAEVVQKGTTKYSLE